MTFQLIKDNHMSWPGWSRYYTSSFTPANRHLIDAAGEYAGVVFQAYENMTISHVWFAPNAVSGSPTCEVRVETVDLSTGLPTGTLWATNTNVISGTLTTSGGVYALTASASITTGDWVSVIFKYNSGTSFTTREFGATLFVQSSPGFGVVNTGTPAKTNFSIAMAVGSSSTSFYCIPGLPGFPTTSTAATTGNINNTNGARTGARFRLPFKAEVHGAIVSLLGFNASDLTFYTDAGTAITGATTSLSPGVHITGRTFIKIGTPFTADANTWYRGAIVPTSASNISLRVLDTPSNDYLTALPGGGDFHRTDYTTAGGWVETNNHQLPYFDILIRRLDDGASSGGGASFSAYPI